MAESRPPVVAFSVGRPKWQAHHPKWVTSGVQRSAAIGQDDRCDTRR